MKVSRQKFDRLVKRAISRIPGELMAHLENISILVEKRPSAKLLKEMEVPPDETLFGVYEGISLLERSSDDPPALPDRILLFQEPLEEACDSMEELEREIEITVVHEIAHFFGMGEERLAELGYE